MKNATKKLTVAGTPVVTACPLCSARVERRVVIGSTYLRLACPCGQDWSFVIHLSVGGAVRVDWTMQ